MFEIRITSNYSHLSGLYIDEIKRMSRSYFIGMLIAGNLTARKRMLADPEQPIDYRIATAAKIARAPCLTQPPQIL